MYVYITYVCTYCSCSTIQSTVRNVVSVLIQYHSTKEYGGIVTVPLILNLGNSGQPHTPSTLLSVQQPLAPFCLKSSHGHRVPVYDMDLYYV
jgi:hypothetical protein